MGKNVAVFVDVANIFYAAKAAGVDIDYVTLLKTASAGRDLVRAYAYTGLDPENENQRNFHDFLRRHGYKVVSKDIRKYGDGKVKANLDIELVVDMMKTARNLDIAIVISGDGDFAPAIRAVQEMGVRVEVISFRGNTSSDLIEVADQFTEITQIARVEKGSSRSGRRVATDDEDLSMTEVPDKQSEGSTGGRGRGRGRGRSRVAEAEPVATTSRGRGRGRAAAAAESVAAVTSDGTPLVVLPGEKLSRAASGAPSVEAGEPLDEEFEEGEAQAESFGGAEPGGEEPRRRRRRRGGRGRGRGRGQGVEDGVAPVGVGPGDEAIAAESADEIDEDELDEADRAPAPARRAAHAFGSVWDSQIGMPTGASGGRAPLADDEDLDEPPIPEYLIAERRQRGAARGGGGRGGRGARGAYAAALERERFGGGRGAGTSRFAEPVARGGREDRPRDDRSRDDRSRGGRGPDRPRGDRAVPRPPARTGSGDEPWSEVPPEIEAMLRAQLGARPPAPARPTRSAEVTTPAEPSSGEMAAAPAAPRRRTARKPADSPAAAAEPSTGLPGSEPVAEAAP
ncbi:MAG: NYN domain-containing protein, partial [Chloroflexota bacterium]